MIIDISNKLVINPKVRDWCKLSYPGHPKGCPNYGKADRCPPKVGMVNDVYDLSKEHFFITKEFNIAQHTLKMRALHPEWSERQLRNCLYWQNKVRIQLEELCKIFVHNHNGYSYELTPEAMGVNVLRTAYLHGLRIKRNPEDIVYKVAFAGIKKNDQSIN